MRLSSRGSRRPGGTGTVLLATPGARGGWPGKEKLLELGHGEFACEGSEGAHGDTSGVVQGLLLAMAVVLVPRMMVRSQLGATCHSAALWPCVQWLIPHAAAHAAVPSLPAPMSHHRAQSLGDCGQGCPS